jgi:hypothetical protein
MVEDMIFILLPLKVRNLYFIISTSAVVCAHVEVLPENLMYLLKVV